MRNKPELCRRMPRRKATPSNGTGSRFARWPSLFRNCRASRQTELENSFPTHVVCAWLGNSPTVASRHYLRVTDGHFEQAIGGAPGGADAAEVVQNNDGQGRTNQDTTKGRNNAETPVSPAKPMKNATPSNGLRGGVQCSQKDSNLRPTD